MKKLLILAAASALVSTAAFAEDYDSNTNRAVDEAKQMEKQMPQTDSSTQLDRSTPMSEHSVASHKSDLLQRKKADEIVGMDIVDAQGNNLGEVEKVVHDTNRNTLLVIEVDEWSIGDKKVVLPTDQLHFNSEEENLQTTMTKDILKAQPKYEESQYLDYGEEEVEAEE